MNRTKISNILTVLFAVVLCYGPVGLAEPLGTAFTYQGRLIDSNNAADGLYDFQFKLYDAASGGNQLNEVNIPETQVDDGYFTVDVNFGNTFDGNERWLDIGVRPGELEDPNVYTVLSPRQEITPTPYALYAKNGGGGGGESLWQVSGSDIFYNNGNVGIGTTSDAKLTVFNPAATDDPTILMNTGGSGSANTFFEIFKNDYDPGYTINQARKGLAITDNSITWTISTNRNAGDWGQKLRFGTLTTAENFTSGFNDWMVIQANGNVGIGTTNPGGRLELFHPTDSALRTKVSDGSTYTYSTYIGNYSGSWWGLTHPFIIQSMDGSGTSDMVFTPILNTSNAGLVIKASGNVGIGTTSPAAKLDVAGQVKITDGSQGTGKVLTSDSSGLATWQTPATGGDNLGNHTATQNIKLSGYWLSGDGGNEGVYVTNTGNVGIGTTTPDQKLTVVGGTIKATTSGGTGVFGETSDISTFTNYGGHFRSAGAYGRGVFGEANNTGGLGVGGYFIAAGGNGVGVHGEASNSGGNTNTGGDFKAAGGNGSIGVKGYASNSGNQGSYGGYFEAASATGCGVFGRATNSGNYTNIGGDFVADGEYGRGVKGWAHHLNGIGVLGVGTNGAVGVDGEAVTSGIGVRSYGADYDFYAAGPGMNYGPFTGGHEVKLSDDFPADIRPGMIVSVTGKTEVRRDDVGKISISSTMPTIKLCDVANDKAVFGVFAAEGPLPQNHWYKAKEGERFSTVNALGEGRVWVCNINGEVQVGDYITTSPVSGYGQKQSDDLLRSCTLGKATESVDWDSVTETVEFGGRTYKVYLIAVVYTSG